MFFPAEDRRLRIRAATAAVEQTFLKSIVGVKAPLSRAVCFLVGNVIDYVGGRVDVRHVGDYLWVFHCDAVCRLINAVQLRWFAVYKFPYFMTYFRRLCFTIVSTVSQPPINSLQPIVTWPPSSVINSHASLHRVSAIITLQTLWRNIGAESRSHNYTGQARGQHNSPVTEYTYKTNNETRNRTLVTR